jgi:hypothetical protein
MLKPVHTTPDSYAPFLLSQGIRMGDVLYISGQAGYDDTGKIVDGGFRTQVSQAGEGEGPPVGLAEAVDLLHPTVDLLQALVNVPAAAPLTMLAWVQAADPLGRHRQRLPSGGGKTNVSRNAKLAPLTS